MTLDELKNKVAQLSADQYAELREWLKNFEPDAWDKQIEQDIKSGKLDEISAEAIRFQRVRKPRDI